MHTHSRSRWFWIGFALALVLVAAGFWLANMQIPYWGSTPQERGVKLPGDEIFAQPVLRWQHGITIHATPEEIYPWLIQMGDTRGGFYSYRGIEKAVMLLAGYGQAGYYENANRVFPEWQSPPIGQGMLLDVVVLRDFQPNRYVVAGPPPQASEGGLQWTWYLAPTADGSTRLLVHLAIQIPGMAENPAVATVTNLATFMMERKMMTGIQLRAEGGVEPNWVQWVEALVWLLVLGTGIAAAVRFLRRPGGRLSLAVGLASIALLFVMTYLQPALLLRLVAALTLAGGLAWDDFRLRKTVQTPGIAPKPAKKSTII